MRTSDSIILHTKLQLLEEIMNVYITNPDPCFIYMIAHKLKSATAKCKHIYKGEKLLLQLCILG